MVPVVRLFSTEH